MDMPMDIIRRVTKNIISLNPIMFTTRKDVQGTMIQTQEAGTIQAEEKLIETI